MSLNGEVRNSGRSPITPLQLDTKEQTMMQTTTKEQTKSRQNADEHERADDDADDHERADEMQTKCRRTIKSRR